MLKLTLQARLEVKVPISKYIAAIGITIALLFFVSSFIRGKFLLKKSELEFNYTLQKGEAEAKEYSLKEIDAKTGLVRWELTATEGATKEKLNSALIKDIKAKVYKKNTVIFELYAPFGKANAAKKEVYLFGGVTTKNKDKNFILKSNELGLGKGTSIEASKGFTLTLKDHGTLEGEAALINDDQTKISVTNLQEANLKDIVISGNKVLIERDEAGNITQASISNGGKIIFKEKEKSSLIAKNIKLLQDKTIEASENIIYTSKDVTFKANLLKIQPEGYIIARKNVQIEHKDTKCFGESLEYDRSSLIIIEGSPKVVQNGQQISADKIEYDLNTGKVRAFGNVKGQVAQKV